MIRTIGVLNTARSINHFPLATLIKVKKTMFWSWMISCISLCFPPRNHGFTTFIYILPLFGLFISLIDIIFLRFDRIKHLIKLNVLIIVYHGICFLNFIEVFLFSRPLLLFLKILYLFNWFSIARTRLINIIIALILCLEFILAG